MKELFGKSWGKKGTSTDIALYTLAKPDIFTTVIPLRYPEKPIPLVLSAHMSDLAVLPISKDGIDQYVAESAILADVLQMNGVRAVIAESAMAFDSYHSQFEKFFKNSHVASWNKYTIEPTDLNTLKDAMLELSIDQYPNTDASVVMVDHAFPVQGVGSVVLGTVVQGTISKGDRIYAFPGEHAGTVRSIQVNDIDEKQAGPHTHVGLAIRGILPKNLQRGTLIASDPDIVEMQSNLEATYRLPPLPVNLENDKKIHAVVGLYDTPAIIEEIKEHSKTSTTLLLRLEKESPTIKGTKVTILDLNAKQRIVGAARL